MTVLLTADTSVTVAASTATLAAHDIAYRTIEGHELRLVDHVLVETYSVLTRLPAIKPEPGLAAELLRRRFTATPLSLPARQRATLIDRFAMAGVAGGAVYDGLIAATAAHHDAVILSLDHRAARTYEVLGARFRLL